MTTIVYGKRLSRRNLMPRSPSLPGASVNGRRSCSSRSSATFTACSNSLPMTSDWLPYHAAASKAPQPQRRRHGESASPTGQTLTHASTKFCSIHRRRRARIDRGNSTQDLTLPRCNDVDLRGAVQARYETAHEVCPLRLRQAERFGSNAFQRRCTHRYVQNAPFMPVRSRKNIKNVRLE